MYACVESRKKLKIGANLATFIKKGAKECITTIHDGSIDLERKYGLKLKILMEFPLHIM